MSVAAKKPNKEQLLKHLTNFKMVLYSNSGNSQQMTAVSKYLDELAENINKQHMLQNPYMDPIDKMHEDSRLFEQAFKERMGREKGKITRQEAKNKRLTSAGSAQLLDSCRLKDRLKERQNMARSSSTMNLKL